MNTKMQSLWSEKTFEALILSSSPQEDNVEINMNRTHEVPLT